MIPACNFIKKKETPSQAISCNQCKILKNTYFEKYLQLIASENLPIAAILILEEISEVAFCWCSTKSAVVDL